LTQTTSCWENNSTQLRGFILGMQGWLNIVIKYTILSESKKDYLISSTDVEKAFDKI
jgi:hypothetical protein